MPTVAVKPTRVDNDWLDRVYEIDDKKLEEMRILDNKLDSQSLQLTALGRLVTRAVISKIRTGVPENRTSPHITAHQPHITRNQDIEA